MSGAQHTPGEWKVANDTGTLILDDYNGGSGPWRQIADARGSDGIGYAQAEANARRIVQCVNAHDELLAALQASERALQALDVDTTYDMPAALRAQIDAAVAKATGSAA